MTWWLPLLILGIGIAIGYISDWYGRRQLPNHPVEAVQNMERWITVPVCVAAIVAGGLIVLGVFLEPGQDASVQTKKLSAALAAAIAGFGTAAFIKSADEADKNWIANRIKTAFHEKYRLQGSDTPPKDSVKYLQQDSDALLWVHAEHVGGIEGWERDARRKRAEELAKHL